jgi:hypothetical protein
MGTEGPAYICLFSRNSIAVEEVVRWLLELERAHRPGERTYENKMFSNVVYAVPNQSHGNVMPRHSSVFSFAKLVGRPKSVNTEPLEAIEG